MLGHLGLPALSLGVISERMNMTNFTYVKTLGLMGRSSMPVKRLARPAMGADRKLSQLVLPLKKNPSFRLSSRHGAKLGTDKGATLHAAMASTNLKHDKQIPGWNS